MYKKDGHRPKNSAFADIYNNFTTKSQVHNKQKSKIFYLKVCALCNRVLACCF